MPKISNEMSLIKNGIGIGLLMCKVKYNEKPQPFTKIKRLRDLNMVISNTDIKSR